MRKNDKFRDYEDNLIGSGVFNEHQINYEASDDGFGPPMLNNQFKKTDTNLKESKSKSRGQGKQDGNLKKEFGGFGGGKSSQIVPDNFFNNYEDFQPGMDFMTNKNSYLPQDSSQQKKFKQPKEDFGNPSTGNKLLYNTNPNKNHNSATIDKKRNQNKGNENLERIQFFNSKTQYSLENNLGQLNIHDENDDDLDDNLSYGFNGKTKPFNENQPNKKDKKKKKGNVNVNHGRGNPHDDRENDAGKKRGNNRKQNDFGGRKGGRDPLDDHSVSSELGIENESTQDLPDMIRQNMYMPQFPQQGQMQMQPQFMQPVYVNSNYQNPMMNQFKQQGGMYPSQYVQIPINNNQQFVPPMHMQQQIYAPRMVNPNFGQVPYQNYAQPQMGLQSMMYHPRFIRVPQGGQSQFNQSYHMQQMKPNDQHVFNSMQLAPNQMQGLGIPRQFDPKFMMNQMQDNQVRMSIPNFNQRTINPIVQQGAFPVMQGNSQTIFPISSQNNLQGNPIQPRMQNPMTSNQNWMMKEDNDRDSDSNQETKENKFMDFGQNDDISNFTKKNNQQQMYRSPQEHQYSGYGDFITDKQIPPQNKALHSGFNYPYSEDSPQDFMSEKKQSESKYFQDYQKYNQQAQEKLDVNAKEYVPNNHLLN